MRLSCLFLFFVLPMLCACSVTSAQLRADPAEIKTFTLNLPYKTALQNYTSTMRNCYCGGVESSYFYLVVKENEESNAARVDYVQDGLTRRVHLSLDFVADGDKTTITYYRLPALFVGYTQDKIAAWASEEKKCERSFFF